MKMFHVWLKPVSPGLKPFFYSCAEVKDWMEKETDPKEVQRFSQQGQK